MELTLGHLDLSAQRLASSANEGLRAKESSNISATHILKSEQELKSHIGEALYEGDEKTAARAAECYILFQYLTADGGIEPKSATQGNISAASSAIDVVLELYQQYSCLHTTSSEGVLQFMGRLLYFHASKG